MRSMGTYGAMPAFERIQKRRELNTTCIDSYIIEFYVQSTQKTQRRHQMQFVASLPRLICYERRSRGAVFDVADWVRNYSCTIVCAQTKSNKVPSVTRQRV